MDGKTLKEMLAFLINEPITSGFLDSKTSYDFLYEAALEYNRLTQALNTVQTITTTGTTDQYVLNPDFLCLRLYNDRNELIVEYDTAAGAISFIPFRPYEQIIQALNTDAVDVPTNCSITDGVPVSSLLTSTCTTTSSNTDPAVLTDSATTFPGTVVVGDTIHNVTDGSHGIITEITSTHVLKAALFYGTANTFTSTNTYKVVPQGRKYLVMDPPTLNAGDTIYVDYVVKPIPVYTSYDSYRFDTSAMFAITKYAAWLYKYRDREPNFGDAFYKFWLAQVSAAVAMTNKAYDRTRFRVNFIKRSLYDRSFR